MTAVREALYRLRPGVRATATAEGLLFRGPLGTFTATGGADLAVLWQRLAPALTGGLSADAIESVCAKGTAGQVVRGLLDSLSAHSMLLTAPADWDRYSIPNAAPGFAGWLDQVAVDPAEAWSRCACREFTVTGTGPIAEAAVAALTSSGMLVKREAADTRLVRLRAAGFEAFAGADARLAFAGPVAEIADRLGLGRSAPSRPVAALAGSLLAHRLLQDVAGVQQPAGPWPEVVIVRPDRLATTTHHWLTGTGSSPADLHAAMPALEALCDPELGPLAELRFAELPQIPLGMAVCGGTLGFGMTVDAARLAAGLAAAERALDPDGGRGVAVGGDELHATGVMLRREMLYRTSPLDGDEYACDGWPSTMAVRLGLDVRCRVASRADGVFVATSASGSRAVEATAEDAAAYALLGAIGAEQAARAGITAVASPMCGATLPSTGPHPELWPSPRDREPEFQRCLRRALPDVRTRRADRAAVPGLQATGFVALERGSTP
ncbi:hypothetical protein AB5J62_22595 [Amycolatopsis sp. cg5]|uniref:hypothetical protein n=1 Tax=Amycolatopsis sp. cg5 TaxID=3238802 RepID=UPI003525571E